MRTALTASAIVTCVALASCASVPIPPAVNPTDGVIAPACEDVDADATFITYNATLGAGVSPQATPRIPHVAEAIGAVSYDALCVQEAFNDHSKLAIAQASGLGPDQVFTEDTMGWLESPKDRCDADEVKDIRACVEKRCADAHPEQTTECAKEHCYGTLVGMYLFHRSCLNCLVASVGKSIDEIVQTCVAGSGSSRFYQGRNGMMLLSPHPMRDRQVVRLPSSAVNRVALLATIDLPSGKSVRVACTQLSTRSATGPTHDDFSSWSEEQRAQAKLVLAALATLPDGVPRPTVLLGDLGFGLGDGGVMAVEPETWGQFSAHGFWSPAMHTEPSMCTQCIGNTLASKKYSFLTDHVMIRAADRVGAVCADTVFTEKKRIVGYFGKELTTNLSSHYGLRVRVALP